MEFRGIFRSTLLVLAVSLVSTALWASGPWQAMGPDGVIGKLNVQDGDRVKAGDVLVQLDDTVPTQISPL